MQDNPGSFTLDVGVCPKCGSWKIRPRRSPGIFSKWRCRECRHAFRKPRAQPDLFDEHHEPWEGLIVNTPRGWLPYRAGDQRDPFASNGSSQNGNQKKPHLQRATVLAVREGRVLLVRYKRGQAYSLPGGHRVREEPFISAAARELHEDTRLDTSEIRYLFMHRGDSNEHHVFAIELEPDAEPRPGQRVSDVIWWDGQEEISTNGHVGEILRKVDLL
ncbi:MAG: NUDIX domain-containing protein [Chloroflexota bacterium]